jgi:integrase
MESWTPHDLRRTARTRGSEDLNVDPIVAEKTLGHALPKILRTYDTSEQWQERVDLLERWSEYVAELVAAA